MFCAVKNYSKMFLQKKPFKQKICSALRQHKFEMSSIKLYSVASGELNLPKLLDNFKVLYKNQFTCLLTKCVFCQNSSLHINKITGNYFGDLRVPDSISWDIITNA